MGALDPDTLSYLADNTLAVRMMSKIVENAFRQHLVARTRRPRRLTADLQAYEAVLHRPVLTDGIHPDHATTRWRAWEGLRTPYLVTLMASRGARRLRQGSSIALQLKPSPRSPQVDGPSVLPAPMARTTAKYGGLREEDRLLQRISKPEVLWGVPSSPPRRTMNRPPEVRNRNVRKKNLPQPSLMALPATRSGTEGRRLSLAPRSIARTATPQQVPTDTSPQGEAWHRGPAWAERGADPATGAGDYTDRGELGRWMVDYLEHQLLRPQLGMTGVDPRITPF